MVFAGQTRRKSFTWDSFETLKGDALKMETMTKSIAGRRLSGLMILLAAAAIGADDATKTIDAGGLTFQAPASWKSSQPANQMRRAQLQVAPAAGDEDPANLIVFAFPGGAGGVAENVKRWERNFKDADGNAPKAEVKTVKGKNAEVTRVEISGHYYPSNFPGQPAQPDKPNYRLIGAIVVGEDMSYFLRLVGPEKTMSSIRSDFDKLIGSISLGGK